MQNKHIIRLSFIGLFLNIIANIVLYRYFIMEEIVIKQISEQNVRIAEIYQNKIWNINQKLTNDLKNQDFNALIQDKIFLKFAYDSYKFFKETKGNISLYDSSGRQLIENNISEFIDFHSEYSTSWYNKIIIFLDKYFLSAYITKAPLIEAIRGKTRHVLISRAMITDKNENTSEKSLISSYIPIINSTNGEFNVEGVLRISIDITDQWDKIIYLEQAVLASFIVVFLIFFAIIMYNTNYAQRVINKQFENNRELEEAKTKAEMESSAKTEFLANVSHELRTPLNAIIGFSEIILSEKYGKISNAQYGDYINDINNSGKHLLSVINDILDFSKASVDKLQIENIDLDLNKLAISSMRFVKPRADSAGVILASDMPQEHVVIKADPKRLKQALLNLLSNSVKFTLSGGTIILSVKKNRLKKLVHIAVADTGIGMGEQDIPKALSSFGQIDNKLSRKYEGTGLGLPLTKKLVELMGGQFDITSKVGEGTTVTLTFPYNDMTL